MKKRERERMEEERKEEGKRERGKERDTERCSAEPGMQLPSRQPALLSLSPRADRAGSAVFFLSCNLIILPASSFRACCTVPCRGQIVLL